MICKTIKKQVFLFSLIEYQEIYIFIIGVYNMAFTIEQIEQLHNSGRMPDRYYYQQNGKTAVENINEQRQKIYDKMYQRELEKIQEEPNIDYKNISLTTEVKIKR